MTWKMIWVEEVKRTKTRMVLEAMVKVSNFPDFLAIAAPLPLLEVHQMYVGSGLRKTVRWGAFWAGIWVGEVERRWVRKKKMMKFSGVAARRGIWRIWDLRAVVYLPALDLVLHRKRRSSLAKSP